MWHHEVMIARALTLCLAMIATCAAVAQTALQAFEQDFNRAKDQAYYRVEFGAKSKTPTKDQVEAMCRGLDKGESKFVVFVHYVGQRNSAYASCGRMKDQPRNTMDVKVF